MIDVENQLVEFIGKGGYTFERERANATFVKGQMYEITHGIIYSSSTEIYIKGFPGGWNNVLFDAPLDVIGEWGCMEHDY